MHVRHSMVWATHRQCGCEYANEACTHNSKAENTVLTIVAKLFADHNVAPSVNHDLLCSLMRNYFGVTIGAAAMIEEARERTTPRRITHSYRVDAELVIILSLSFI